MNKSPSDKSFSNAQLLKLNQKNLWSPNNKKSTPCPKNKSRRSNFDISCQTVEQQIDLGDSTPISNLPHLWCKNPRKLFHQDKINKNLLSMKDWDPSKAGGKISLLISESKAFLIWIPMPMLSCQMMDVTNMSAKDAAFLGTSKLTKTLWCTLISIPIISIHYQSIKLCLSTTSLQVLRKKIDSLLSLVWDDLSSRVVLIAPHKVSYSNRGRSTRSFARWGNKGS